MAQRLFGPRGTFAHAGWLCVAAGLGLSALGLYAIDVATVFAPDAPAPGLSNPGPRAATQAIYLAVGLLAGAIVALPRPDWPRLLAWPLMALSVALLIFLLLPFVPSWLVRPRNGARGWIDLGPVDFQPGELAKIAFVLAAAEYLRFRKNHRTLAGLVPPAVIAAVPVGLITLQPDLGTASLFIPALFAMLLCAGARVKHLVVIVLAAALAAPAMYPLLRPHQQERIAGLIKLVRAGPAAAEDPDLFQATTAITLAGSGGAAGLGEAEARALSRFTRLPARHNDMIYAVIVARFGLLGGLLVFALSGLWIAGAMIAAAACKDAFGRLVLVGFAAIMAAQLVVNVGMNVGVLPIVGVTLPFVSYGGSSMLTVWLMTGLAVGVAARRPPRLARPTFEFADR